MKKIILFIFVATGFIIAQENIMVEVKGVGNDRNEAINDGLRRAVEQALGTRVVSETEIRNYELVRDILQTRAQGYVSKYEIIDEIPFPDRYEVRIRAWVNQSPLKQDAVSLSQRFGGIRFMVYYDPEKLVNPQDSERYEYFAERINEYLSRKGYRYAERGVIQKLLREARELYKEDSSDLTLAQEIAFAADAEFYIEISRINVEVNKRALNIYACDVSADLKLYDAGTAEGITSIVCRSENTHVAYNEVDAIRSAIDDAVKNGMDKLLYVGVRRFGDWLNNGYPYLLRFYGTGGYRVLRRLKDMLRRDPHFGGEMDIKSVRNFHELNITFKKTADECADAVLDYAERIPELSGLDVRLFIFNQINFAMPGASVPQPKLVGVIKK